MTHQTASGAASTPAPRTRLNHGSSTRGSAVRMDSPLPLRSPAVSLRYFIRRGIGGSVLDRSANATRDFSEQSGAFRGSADDSTTVGGVTPLRRPLANGGTLLVFHFSRSPERLSTLPGHVASGHLAAWRRSTDSLTLKGGATNSPHTSEIAAGRSIGPSRRPVTIQSRRSNAVSHRSFPVGDWIACRYCSVHRNDQGHRSGERGNAFVSYRSARSGDWMGRRVWMASVFLHRHPGKFRMDSTAVRRDCSRTRLAIHGGSVQKFIAPTLAALIIIAPTGRKETDDVAISLQAGRPMPLNRQAEDVLIDLELWRRASLANNGRIDPEEAMEALPMVEEAQRILSLMAPTWGQLNSMLDAATGMFSPKVQRNNREIVSRYPDNIVAFPVARDHAAGD